GRAKAERKDYTMQKVTTRRYYICACALLMVLMAVSLNTNDRVSAQADGPTMFAPNLAVKKLIGGLVTPTSMAFIGPNDILVLEKNTGKVQRVLPLNPSRLFNIIEGIGAPQQRKRHISDGNAASSHTFLRAMMCVPMHHQISACGINRFGQQV